MCMYVSIQNNDDCKIRIEIAVVQVQRSDSWADTMEWEGYKQTCMHRPWAQCVSAEGMGACGQSPSL